MKSRKVSCGLPAALVAPLPAKARGLSRMLLEARAVRVTNERRLKAGIASPPCTEWDMRAVGSSRACVTRVDNEEGVGPFMVA